MEETVCPGQSNESVTSLLLNLTAQQEFASDRIQHLIVSLDVIDINSKSEFEILYKCVEILVKPGLVDNLSEEREYGPEDFPHTVPSAIEAFSDLKCLLQKLKIKSSKHQRDILIPILILCGTHNRSFPWSNENTVNLSHEISNSILLYSNTSSLKNVLCHTDENCKSSLFKRILLLLRSQLTKHTWAKNPSICYIFQWLLKHITHPNLTEYLSDILPPSLMFTDHHWAQYKCVGIGCLYHIIDNVPFTELKTYGRSDVVYDALFNLLYCKEIEVIRILYPCILKLLVGLEGTMHSQHESRRWNRYDDVYGQLIWHMELEDKLVLRREYSKIVSQYIQVMGITILKYLKRSLKVFLEYLSISDSPEEIARINCLKALCILIKVAWPRMEGHFYEITKSIMTLVYDMEMEKHKSTLNEETIHCVIDNSKECLTLLKAACPEKFQEALSDLETLNRDFPGISILNDLK